VYLLTVFAYLLICNKARVRISMKHDMIPISSIIPILKYTPSSLASLVVAGTAVGCCDGKMVGLAVGENVGKDVGRVVGNVELVTVGSAVGDSEGIVDGGVDEVGIRDGDIVGFVEGSL
jgi:hypothetical protein